MTCALLGRLLTLPTQCGLLCLELISQLWAFHNDTKRGVAVSVEDSGVEAPKSPNLFRSRSLWLCGGFYLVYQGIEGGQRFLFCGHWLGLTGI